MSRDVLGLESDKQEGEPLIELVMQGGKRVAPVTPLSQSRERAARELARLPKPLRRLELGASYVVEVAAGLQQLAAEVDSRSK
jgi:nicotinate phosphoribosyltransferase